MSMHPLTANEVARLRSDEKLARGLATYAVREARPDARTWFAALPSARGVLRRRKARLTDPTAV